MKLVVSILIKLQMIWEMDMNGFISRMSKLIISTFSSIGLFSANIVTNVASDDNSISVNGTVYEIPDRMNGCNITVHQNGVPTIFTKADEEGNFSLKLSLGSNYVVEFSYVGYVSKKIIELTKKDFTQLNYRLNASGEVSYEANNVYYGGKRGYATNVKIRLSLTSHLLSSDEYEWLSELFVSPDVYLDDGTGKFIPVTIGANNYEYRTYKNSRLTPLQFDIEFGDVYNSQFL